MAHQNKILVLKALLIRDGRNHMKKVILFFLMFILVAMAASCSAKERESSTTLSAEEVVRDYFTYWNEKNGSKLEKVLSPEKRGITWEMDKLEHVKLLNIKENGSATKDDNQRIFNVVFEIKFKDGSGSGLSDGKWTWSYMLKRDDKNKPWLIHDWGV
jgi:hypothetical protein